jgi:hypothetical protein
LSIYEFFRGGKKMKKIVIILFFFIVSISVFAQDTSLFVRNFSLTKYSKANNHSLFNPDNLIYVQRKNISTEEKLDSLAEGYLRRLAESSKKSRKTRSAVGLIGGGICLGIGAAVISSADEKSGWDGLLEGLGGVMLMAAGTVGVIGGTLSLAIPSGAEREHKDVLRISDPAQRERASHEALSSLAARGRRSRILSGIVEASLSVSYLFATVESLSLRYITAATWGAFAVYSFFVKSRAERTYQNYLKEKEYQKGLELRLGIMPYGGVKIDLAFSF